MKKYYKIIWKQNGGALTFNFNNQNLLLQNVRFEQNVARVGYVWVIINIINLFLFKLGGAIYLGSENKNFKAEACSFLNNSGDSVSI